MMLAHSPADVLSSLLLVLLWLGLDLVAVVVGIAAIRTSWAKRHRGWTVLRGAGFAFGFGVVSVAWLYGYMRDWFEEWWLYALATAPVILGTVALLGMLRTHSNAEQTEPGNRRQASRVRSVSVI